ncbi:retinol dehydrogenase 16 [Aplysia californica]|uniref:Retinol dehydrogenase 16 n=1 Tax=Aplysia californica TaxID=6500 RepID=A0ABM1VSG9_APLCA|nr:retinol dehydrogenase 16 [Aplysia californica]
MLFVTLAVVVVLAYLLNRWFRSLKLQELEGKNVLITGCDTGFGHELAIRLDSMNFHVFAGCLTESGQQNLKQRCSTRLTVFPLDVSDSNSILEAERGVREKLVQKGLWALVNNAGVTGLLAPVEICTKQDFEAAIKVNLLGPIEMTKAFLPALRKVGGRVVNMTSCAGRVAALTAPYCVTKFGLEALSDILRSVWLALVHVSVFMMEVTIQHGFFFSLLQLSPFSSPVHSCMQYFSDHSSTTIDHVIDAYVHAITARYPRTRYVVGIDAKYVYIPLSFLPDWLTDFLISQFKKRIMAWDK